MTSRSDGQLDADPVGGDGGLLLRIDELLDEMERYVAEHHGCDCASWRSGDFTAGAMLEFKGRHRDGRLAHWVVADLHEFLLVWLPAFVLTDDDVLRDVPACSATFFDFLAHRGLLTGAPLEELRTACERLGEEFLAACADPQRWSPAKARLVRALDTAEPAHPASAADRDRD